MAHPVKITVFELGRNPAIEYFRKETRNNEIKYLDKVEIDSEAEPFHIGLPEEVDGKIVLKLGSQKARELFQKLKEEKGLRGDKNEVYFVEEPIEKFVDLNPYEQSVHGALKSADEILDRAYNRRTNVSSWILYLILKHYGFCKDDYEPIRKIITGEKEGGFDPDFIRKYANYLKLNKEDKLKAKEFIQNAFEDDNDKKQKQGLVKLVSFVLGVSDKISDGFLNWAPISYAVQNLAMPTLATFVKKGFLGRFFHYMRLINPWLGEVIEWFGNFKKELKDLKQELQDVYDPFRENSKVQDFDSANKNSDSKDIIEEVEIVKLDKEQYGLKKVVNRVDEVFDRVLGKKTTFTSLVLSGILTLFGKDYKSFTKQFVEDDGFIKNLCKHLKNVKESVEDKQKEPELSKKIFDGAKYYVAKIVLGAVSVANALPKWVIKEASDILGLIFGVQNLIMPLLAELVKKGRFSSLIPFIRDINPWLNDIVDWVSNFRKEILDVKEQNKKIEGLLPTFSPDMVFGTVFSNLKSLWKTVSQFRTKVFGKSLPKAA